MVLDHSHLEALSGYLPADDMRQLLALLPAQLDAQISSIETLLATETSQRSPARRTVCRRRKHYGAFKLSHFAREIEVACESADVEGVARRARRLAALSEEACAGLSDWLTARDRGSTPSRRALRRRADRRVHLHVPRRANPPPALERSSL